MYYSRRLLTTQFLTFNRLNLQNNTTKFKANKKKFLQCFVLSNSLSNLRSKLVTDDVIKNVCDVITLMQFLVCNQKPNSHFQFEPSIDHFFKNFGYDVTSNDVINFKEKCLKPELKNQLLFKTWHFCNFWIGCWIVKTL